MARLIGTYLYVLRNLRFHLWVDIPLNSWLITLILLLSPLPLTGILPGGLALSLGFLLLTFTIVFSQWWARRRFYIHFVAEGQISDPGEQQPLWPEDKLLLFATGRFEVEGRRDRFTNLMAYYRTFETREHVVMARITPTRYLRLGRTPVDVLGMWYLFITPDYLNQVVAGNMYYGTEPQPALKLNFTRLNDKGKRIPMVAYLSFASEADRLRVYADLLLDMGGPANIPWRRTA